MSSYICYWWIEIHFHEDNQIFQAEIITDDLTIKHPIFSKYSHEPYHINVRNIINEANQKYQQNRDKYLVYSCPFMCGGKKRI